MKAHYYDLNGKMIKSIEMPLQFHEAIRPDLVLRAFKAIQHNNRQPYGAFHRAGQRASAFLSRRRRDFKTSYGIGMSRVPRKTVWRRGRRFGWIGAFSPGTVGGRPAHPPKADKDWTQKMNRKERQQALCSALSATIVPSYVKSRGHRFTELPSVIDAKVESLAKTKDVRALLTKLQLHNELDRITVRKIRAGRGKNRGRPYKTKIGPLFVVSHHDVPLRKAAVNIPGVDVCAAPYLNMGLLAPGGQPGRLTIYSEKALELLGATKLFTPEHVAEQRVKKPVAAPATKPAMKATKKPAPKKTATGAKR